jgi:site-specific DNA recombinase
MQNDTPKAQTTAALGYMRISDQKQIKGESKHNQRAAIENYAKTHGIKVIKWFYDEAKSGKNTEREELQKLLKLALSMKDSISYVLVYKMSRASRDLDSYVIGVRSVLAARGIEVRSVTEPFDNSPMGRFMENLYVMVGQLDNEIKKETVIDNMKRLAEQGYWQHKPIRGYIMAKTHNSQGQPRPTMKPGVEADKVTSILLRYNEGDITEAALVRYATSIGFIGLNGKPLTQDVLHKMLVRPEYAGYLHDGFTNFLSVDGQHPGLISREIYWQNQHIIKSKNKEYLLGVKHQTANDMYPLRKFVLCVNCSLPMTACAPSSSPRYFCSRKTCRGTGSMMTDIAHDKFLALLRSIEPTQETVAKMKTVMKEHSVKELGNINHEVAELRTKLSDLAEIRTNAIKQFISGKISEEDKKEAVDSIDTEKLELKQQLDGLEQEQTLSEASIDYALNFMTDIAKQWADADLELKQKIQTVVFPKGFTLDIKQGNFISADISPLYRVALEENETLQAVNVVMVTLSYPIYNIITREIIRWNTLLRDSFMTRTLSVGFV